MTGVQTCALPIWVLAGDAVDGTSGTRERLKPDERSEIARLARIALERMIEVVGD